MLLVPAIPSHPPAVAVVVVVVVLVVVVVVVVVSVLYMPLPFMRESAMWINGGWRMKWYGRHSMAVALQDEIVLQ